MIDKNKDIRVAGTNIYLDNKGRLYTPDVLSAKEQAVRVQDAVDALAWAFTDVIKGLNESRDIARREYANAVEKEFNTIDAEYEVLSEEEK